MEEGLKTIERKTLIDMRKYKSETDLRRAYFMAFQDFLQVTCDEIQKVTVRLQEQFPGCGWTVSDISITKLQLSMLRTDESTGKPLHGPNILYTFGFKDNEKHNNFFIDTPTFDDTVRTYSNDNTQIVELCQDHNSTRRVVRNMRFNNYIEVEMHNFLKAYYYAYEDINQFTSEMNRRGMEIPKVEIADPEEDNND